MSNSDHFALDAEIIDITLKKKRNSGQRKWIILAPMFLLFVVLLSSVGIYTE